MAEKSSIYQYLLGKVGASHIDKAAVPADEQSSTMDDPEKTPITEGYAPDTFRKEAHVLDDPDVQAREKKYLWKLDCMILPTISALYFFEYLDRGNIAGEDTDGNAKNAKTLGIDEGHDTPDQGAGAGTTTLSALQWEVIIMIFYIGLVLFQIPGCIGYRVFSPSKWIAFGVCGWASVCLLQCTVYNYGGLIACRIFLGTFEGLFGTGIIYYLSLWYRRTELGMRVFWFLGPTSVAGAFGGIIAYGVSTITTTTPTWKWLFVIEALPCFCLGLFCLYWLPDRPLQNSRFKGDQQQIAVARYHSEVVDKAGPIRKQHVIWAFSDWKMYSQAALYIPLAALLASISNFLPTLIEELGYTSETSANLYTVPPYACAFGLMFVVSYSSDHFKERGIHIATLMSVAAVCYILLALLSDNQLHAKYALTCISVACVYATYPPSHAWAANCFPNETHRAIGMGVYTAIGNLGSIAGSWFYPTTDAPRYEKGHFICFGMCCAAAVIAFGNSMALGYVNRQRDRKYGKPIEGVPVDVGTEREGGKMFRFIT